MTGMELIIGGKFAAAAIGKVVNLGGSYLGDNYDLHFGTGKILENLKNQLPHIQCVIEAAKKRQITNTGVDTWLEQLKDAAYEAEDVLDKFESKRIRESIKGKGKISEITSSSGKMVKTLFFLDKDLKELNSVVDKLDKLCMRTGEFIKILELIHSENFLDNLGSHSETCSNLDPGLVIFGRDKEIELILDMIFNVLYGDFYPQALDDPNIEQGEDAGSSSFSLRIFKSFLYWGKSGKSMPFRTVQKDYPAEQLKNNLRDPSGPWHSMFSDTVKKGDNIRKMIFTTAEPDSISNRKLAVIPIVGLGGVGKTTVAKKIYNDGRVEKHFALRAWVYISENYDAKNIMQEMLCSFENHTIDPLMSLEYAGKKLKEIIKNHRFLLILDNLSDRTKHIWSRLEEVLLYGVVGSVVVVTTQSISIANAVETLPKVTLDVFKPDSFWELFQYYAFGGLKLGDLSDQPPSFRSKQEELQLIGHEIANKLHGLPLAGKVIGTLLSARLEKEFWEEIRGSDWWNIKDVRENILPFIGVGYNYLDPELKQCFVYCSIFPKSYVFERERLVQMWIAQGFIQPDKEDTSRLDKGQIRLEDIGRKWFGELVDRSFFQPTLSDGKYIMHDLVRDLAIAVSSNEFCFLKNHDNFLPSLPRHLGIDCDNLEVEWKCNESTRLRTLILFGNWTKCSDKSIRNIFAKCNGLRVLDLSYIVLETNEPINAACRLLHLRCVDLSFTGIKSIPDEFCALCHLEVLDVRGCNFKKLPEGMNQLINLRHLYASFDTISLISNIGKLTKLQELEEFRVERSNGHRISELKDMNEISGHLLLSKLHNVSSKEEAAKSELDKKKYLKSLEFRFEYNYGPTTKVKMQILDALKPPCSLEILKVGGCRGTYLPGWVFSSPHGLCNLKVIHVSNFWLSSLPAFGELPSLEILSFDDLQLLKKVGSDFYGSSEVVFPSLKELTFSNMRAWSDWSGTESGKTIFPRLKKLHLVNCEELQELPMDSFTSSVVVDLLLSGCCCLHIAEILQGMPSLTYLSIKDCSSFDIFCTLLKSLEVMHLSTLDFEHSRPVRLRFVGGLKSLVSLRKLVIKGFHEVLESYEVEQDDDEISQEENEEQCLQFLTYLHLGYREYSTNRLLTSEYSIQRLLRPEYSTQRLLRSAGKLSSLRTLLIEHSYAREYVRDEESWFNQLTSLEKLQFHGCENLIHLPSTLHLLTSLKKLHISNCPLLLSLPETGLPQNLAELYIKNCPYLIHKCQLNQGGDWHKICHIPFVHFED